MSRTARAAPFDGMEAPAADRPLDESIVRSALGEEFPDRDVRSVEALGAGWEREAYLVDGHVVVHFPRYAAVAEDLDRHARILELVHGAVGGAVRVPEITFRGEGGGHFPHPFFGHELIPGQAADPLKPPSSPRLATDLGDALSEVHAISGASARDLGIGVDSSSCEADLELLIEQAEHLRGQAERVERAAGVGRTAFEWLARRPEVPETYAGPERFVHADLQPDHILVDPGSERLSGIIDWTGASLGDPTLDFSYLLVLHGEDFLEAALAAYSLPTDPGFLSRTRFRARVRALGWLVNAMHRDADRTRVLREVENAFGA